MKIIFGAMSNSEIACGS